MPTWEYYTLRVRVSRAPGIGIEGEPLRVNFHDPDEPRETLTLEELGQNGWELVTMATKDVPFAIFKRPATAMGDRS